mmetsp:Transcript_17353/g.47895  ORF Transcript_17353/g.47895 Transcript_17353/m.47895 type:complete len:250 (-) Transcript_17353:891-1640(-)
MVATWELVLLHPMDITDSIRLLRGDTHPTVDPGALHPWDLGIPCGNRDTPLHIHGATVPRVLHLPDQCIPSTVAHPWVPIVATTEAAILLGVLPLCRDIHQVGHHHAEGESHRDLIHRPDQHQRMFLPVVLLLRMGAVRHHNRATKGVIISLPRDRHRHPMAAVRIPRTVLHLRCIGARRHLNRMAVHRHRPNPPQCTETLLPALLQANRVRARLRKCWVAERMVAQRLPLPGRMLPTLTICFPHALER